MARRADHSREELYDMILEAAEGIVEREGLRALTARRVAEAIGYSPGTLYNLFDNLDDIILHLNGRTLDRLYGTLPPPDPALSVEQNMGYLLEAYLDFVENNRALWRVLFDHSQSEELDLPDWYCTKVAKLMELIDDALAPLFSAAGADQKRLATSTLWAGIHGICSLAESGKLQIVSAVSLRDMARFLVEQVLRGLAGR